jgi:hypothetical protein
MSNFSLHEIDIILKKKESYYKGLSKGSHHDKKVAFYALQILSGIRREFEQAHKEK